MSDTKVQRLRGISKWLDVTGWTNMANNVREAADELERLSRIETAAKAWRGSRGTIHEGVEAANLMLATEEKP